MASYSFNKNHKRPASQAGNTLTPARKTTDDFYNSGMPGENPFVSMYQATINAAANARAQSSHKHTRTMTPNGKRSQKQAQVRNCLSDAKLSTVVKAENGRKFGEYSGAFEVDPMASDSIWGASPCK